MRERQRLERPWRVCSRAITNAAAAALALSLGTSAGATDPATHGRDAVPDYDRVFPQDRVTRLDL